MAGEYNEERTRAVENTERWLRQRLSSGPPLLLDGAMGTELERSGLTGELPLWSARALIESPETIAKIHQAYAAAGAEILTTNTFRTQSRSLTRAKQSQSARQLTGLATKIAKKAAHESTKTVLVAGSVSPLEDCYEPGRVPDDASLRREHHEHVGFLSEAGVDLLLIETMNSIREADAATEAATESGLPFFISFICTGDAQLLSGESLADAAGAALKQGAQCVLVNCLPASQVSACLLVLRSVVQKHAALHSETGFFGVYPNLLPPRESGETQLATPQDFARDAEAWVAGGARALGGCCGSTPSHIHALSTHDQANQIED